LPQTWKTWNIQGFFERENSTESLANSVQYRGKIVTNKIVFIHPSTICVKQPSTV